MECDEHMLKKCRLCSGELKLILDLGRHSLSGVFPAAVSEDVESGPLRLLRCVSPDGCGLVQLGDSFDPEAMYGDNYGYRSGLNPTMVEHLHTKVASICDSVRFRPGDLVVDVGSNDGTTLAAYPEQLGLSLLGIDPSGEKFRGHYQANTNLCAEFFSAAIALEWSNGQQARVVTSFSMLYDLEDPLAFAKDVKQLLCNGGIWVFEQSYLPLMIENNSFDTVCHEHIEYYSLAQIRWMLEHAGLSMLDVEFNAINGGSFSVTAINGEAEPSDRLRDAMQAEKALALDTEAPYAAFASRTVGAREAIKEFLKWAEMHGKRVAAIGASTKGNTLLQYSGVRADQIECIGEVNPDKFGCFTPGTHIPIIDESLLLDSEIDYFFVLPWHFRDFFVGNPRYSGKKLVFPLPSLEIVTVA